MQSKTSNLTFKFRGYMWGKVNVKETNFSYSILNIHVFTIRQSCSFIERKATPKIAVLSKGKGYVNCTKDLLT